MLQRCFMFDGTLWFASVGGGDAKRKEKYLLYILLTFNDQYKLKKEIHYTYIYCVT